MLEEINSRGLEVFTALLLLFGEANIISVTLNKQQGFFTLNVGSKFFDWRTPLEVTTSTTQAQTRPALADTEDIPIKPHLAFDSCLSNSTEDAETTTSDAMILLGIFIIAVFLLEDPFIDITHSTNT